MLTKQPEEWRPIPGYPGYEASTRGRIRSTDRTVVTSRGVTRHYPAQILATYTNSNRGGHLSINLGAKKSIRVHKAVALAFLGPPPFPGAEIRHRPDRDPANNRPDNLQYGTRSDNMQDRIADGNNPQLNRTHCPWGHPYSGPNLRITKRGSRACKACANSNYRMRRYGETKQVASDTAYRKIIGQSATS